MPCPCHLGNRRKYACAGRSAQLILSVLLSFAALSLAKVAAASTGIAISSNGLRFGSVTVGTSLTRRVTLTNVGTCSITVSQATVTGAGLSVSGLVLPLTVNAHHNASFNVEFAPAVDGSVTGTLSIVSDASDLPSSLSLSGTGVAQPTANLSPPSMTSASQALESTSSAQAVTVTNSGDTTLDTPSIAPTGAYASGFAQTNDCGTSVAARTNCTTSVAFTPAASGTRAAAVTLTDNATGSPQATSLLRTGTSALSISPTSLAFGSQSVNTTSTAQTVTLSNTGNAALSITSLAVHGYQWQQLCADQHVRQVAGGRRPLHNQRDVHAFGQWQPHGLGEHHGQCQWQPADGEPLRDRHAHRWPRLPWTAFHPPALPSATSP